MIAGMIEDEQRFPEKALPVTIGKGRVDFLRGLVQQPDKGLAIGNGLFDRSFEITGFGRRLFLWPVSLGPGWALVFRAATKFKDIPLRDPDVLRQLP